MVYQPLVEICWHFNWTYDLMDTNTNTREIRPGNMNGVYIDTNQDNRERNSNAQMLENAQSITIILTIYLYL